MTFHLLAQAQNAGEGVVRHYLDKLASPEGLVVVVTSLLVAVGIFVFDRAKWALLTAAIYFSTFSVARADWVTPLPTPFRQIGEWSQALTLGAIGLLAIAAVRPMPWRHPRLVHVAAIALICLQTAVCVRQASGGFAEKGLAGLVVQLALFGVLGIGLNRWLYDERHARSLAGAVSWGAGLVILSSLASMLINYSSVLVSQRFLGTTANPQRLGAMLAMAVPFSLALVADRRNVPASRVVHGAILAFAVLMILASGSRTGVLLLLIGVTAFFRLRLGPALLTAAGVAALALVGYLVILGEVVSDSVGTVLRTNDSRSDVWATLWQLFLADPVFGTPSETVPGESSYLSTLVMAGVVGFLPLLVLVGVLVASAVKTLSRRWTLGPLTSIGDLGVAAVAQLVPLWAFEASVLGVATDHVLMLYCLFALLGLLRERVASPAGLAPPPEDAAGGADAVDNAGAGDGEGEHAQLLPA